MELLTDRPDAVLEEEGGWRHVWEDLPELVPERIPELEEYKNLEITYSVAENLPVDGYTCLVTGHMAAGYTVTNTHKPAPVRHTVTYVVVNGVWSDGTKTPKTEAVEAGQSPAQIPAGMIAAAGYEGGAWSPDPDGAAITGDTTFTYTFTAKQSLPPATSAIRYDLNGGTLDGKTGTVTIQVENGAIIILPAPTREGYTFDYWEGSRYSAGESYTVNGDHTFTAQWKENSSDVPEEDDTGETSPKTGDESAPRLYGGLMLLSAAVTAFLLVYRRRRKAAE